MGNAEEIQKVENLVNKSELQSKEASLNAKKKKLNIEERQTRILEEQSSFNRIIALTGAILSLLAIVGFLLGETINKIEGWARLSVALFFTALAILLISYIVSNVKYLDTGERWKLKPYQSWIIVIVLMILSLLLVYIIIMPFIQSIIVNDDNEQEQETVEPEYICNYNAYNCINFTTHAEAQAVYEACGGVNNDVHRLDRDEDGLACESLP